MSKRSERIKFEYTVESSRNLKFSPWTVEIYFAYSGARHIPTKLLPTTNEFLHVLDSKSVSFGLVTCNIISIILFFLKNLKLSMTHSMCVQPILKFFNTIIANTQDIAPKINKPMMPINFFPYFHIG
jgi:hypothetical protein